MWAAEYSIPVAPLLAGLSPILVAAIPAWFLFRGTRATAVSDREKQLDEQVDADRTQLRARVAALEEQNERLTSALSASRQQTDRVQEQYARLRLAVIDRHMDPDELLGGGQREQTPPAG